MSACIEVTGAEDIQPLNCQTIVPNVGMDDLILEFH